AACAALAPAGPSCDSLGSGDRAYLARHCRDDHWTADAIRCVAGDSGAAPYERCIDDLTGKQVKALDADSERIDTAIGALDRLKDAACACKAATCAHDMGAPISAWDGDNASIDPDEAAAGRLAAARSAIDRCLVQTGGISKTGLPECDAYVAAMQAYIQCDKVPQSAREAAQEGL